MRKKEPDAKVIAMINDLSPSALSSLLCFNPRLAAHFRQNLLYLYRNGDLLDQTVIEAWEDDQE